MIAIIRPRESVSHRTQLKMVKVNIAPVFGVMVGDEYVSKPQSYDAQMVRQN
jgi:hypothetical protein